MSKAVYKRLGNFIREVNVRNRELKVTKLVGLTIDKTFIPSVANVIGTDLSTYKIIRKEQFACSLMQVSRDGKMPIAMFTEDEAIMSPAYPIFEIINKNVLLPQYLMMWLTRSEFDREASYYAVGGVRGSLTWEDFCNLRLPVPTIERQHEIVTEYETLSNRIRLNEQMIKKLEETAQALYRKMFVDNIDKENLPDGWRMGTLGEIANVSSGNTCFNKMNKKEPPYIYPIAGASSIIGYSSSFNSEEQVLTTGRVGTLGVINKYRGKTYMADNVLVIKSHYYEFCYQLLQLLDYNEIAKGGVQSLITQTDLKAVEILIPNTGVLTEYENTVSPLFEMIEIKQQENENNTELQSLLLAKMGQ